MQNKQVKRVSVGVILGLMTALILLVLAPGTNAQTDNENKPKQPMLGKVLVKTVPSGATITVDGKELGITPLTIEIPTGDKEIFLHKEGYSRISATVKVRVGKRLIVSRRLRKATGGLVLKNLVPKSYIYIDGKRRARTKGSEATFKVVDAGRRKVRITQEHMLEKNFEVDIKDGVVAEIRVEQVPKPGRVIISSKPLMASVFIDGKLVGHTPITASLDDGRHEVTVKMKGYPDMKDQITVETKKLYSMHFDLTLSKKPKPEPGDKPENKPEPK